ncbi:MAG TPA: response regulator [Dissulfurispiraceae bacterium]|nr:response regulator [Dissulfurispiraceae bacterium]
MEKLRWHSKAYDAMDKISAKHYDLCFLELQLPDASGLEVIRRIEEFSPDTKIIIMIAPPLSDSSWESIGKETYQLITKPFDLTEIKYVLNSPTA